MRALVTIAGNPLRLDPRRRRLEAAVEGLDFMVSLDIYVNETTRHADVILPAPEPLAKAHYDFALYQLAIRSIANYSPPVIDAAADQPQEWETVLRLAAIAAGQGPDADIEAWDELVVGTLIEPRDGERGLADRGPRPGRDRRGARAAARPGADARPDAAHRPVRRRVRRRPGRARRWRSSSRPRTGSTSARCGPRLPEVLRTPVGQDRAGAGRDRRRHPPARGRAGGERRAAEPSNGHMVLIGRRQLRSNNSWMHNLPPLVKGKDRCTLLIHPDDAERLGIARRRRGDGALAERRAQRAGRGHRGDHARGGLDPARLGPRRSRACG